MVHNTTNYVANVNNVALMTFALKFWINLPKLLFSENLDLTLLGKCMRIGNTLLFFAPDLYKELLDLVLECNSLT